MGSTDNAAAGTSAKISSAKTSEFVNTPAPSPASGPASGLSGSVGIGGANAPGDVFQVSSALSENGLMDAPQNTADNTLYKGIIGAQERMGNNLKRDGLVNPGGPTQQTYTRLGDQGFVKTPVQIKSSPQPLAENPAGHTDAPGTQHVMPVDEANSAANAKLLEQQNTRMRKQARHTDSVKRQQAEQQAVAARKQARQAAKVQRDQADDIAHQQHKKQQQAVNAVKKLTSAVYERMNGTQHIPSRPTKGESQGIDKGEGMHNTQKENLGPRIRGDDDLGKQPALSDEVFQSNQRLVSALAKRNGVGDLPKFTTDAINSNSAKAIPEVADLIQQVHAKDPAQAKELFEKTVHSIGDNDRRSLEELIHTMEFDPERSGPISFRTKPAHPEDGYPEAKPMGAKGREGSGDDAPLQGVTMDENGRYYDREGKRIENPDKNPNLKKAQFVPVAPAPGVMPPPPGTIQPATPQEVQKALDRAQGDLEKLASDPAFLKTPVGQAMIAQGVFKDLISEGDIRQRTDAAPKLPNREEFPAHEGDPDDGMLPGRSTAHDRVINPPPYEIPETGQFDIPPSEDKSEDQLYSNEIYKIEPISEDQQKPISGNVPKSAERMINQYTPEQKDALTKAIFTEGKLVGKGNNGIVVETGKSVGDRETTQKNIIEALGGEKKVAKSDIVNGKQRHTMKDGTVILQHSSNNSGHTVDIHFPNRNESGKKYMIKLRFD